MPYLQQDLLTVFVSDFKGTRSLLLMKITKSSFLFLILSVLRVVNSFRNLHNVLRNKNRSLNKIVIIYIYL